MHYTPLSDLDKRDSLKKGNYSIEQITLFYQIALNTIDSVIEYKYINFDAHTTSNCCHGIALFSYEQIEQLGNVNLHSLRSELSTRIINIESLFHVNPTSLLEFQIPLPVLNLMALYTLCFTKETNLEVGNRTNKRKLRTLCQVTTRFCEYFIDALQKHISNLIVERYSRYVERILEHKNFKIHGIHLKYWAKYASNNFLRIDSRGVKYAASMFSMRIIIASLIFKKSKIAIINDILDESGNLIDRITHIYIGDGSAGFKEINIETINKNQNIPNEPILIFAGCCNLNQTKLVELQTLMDSWKNNLIDVLLACDLEYPHFPLVSSDPEFNNCKIIPEEPSLKFLLDNKLQANGYSIRDPSIFCLAHIYTADIHSVLSLSNKIENDRLPISFIPTKINNYLIESNAD
jgi:hypothetical protein